MAPKRKRQSFSSRAVPKRQKPAANEPKSGAKQPPIQSISVSSITPSSADDNGLISTIPHETLTQILTYVLVNNKRKTITLHSGANRRWKNEVIDLSGTRRSYDRYFGCYHGTHKVNKSYLLDILLVNRSFYFAGIAAFFGENVLQFDDVQHLDRLTSTLDQDRRRCIRHILFHVHIDQLLLYYKKNYTDKGIAPILTGEWGAVVGESLRACFERLPSLVTAQLNCSLSHEPSLEKIHHYRRKFRELFEQLKEATGKKGEEALKLELTACDATLCDEWDQDL